MTYQEFIDYIKQKAHEELSYDTEMMEFYEKGYTSDDPKKLEWIRDCNRKYTGIDGDELRTDFLLLKKGERNDITLGQRIAIEQMFTDCEFNGGDISAAEKEFDKIRQMRKGIDESAIDYQRIAKRGKSKYDDIKDQLILRPLNYKLHIRELSECVYKRRGEFSLVLYQLIGDANHTLTTSKIKREELKNWGMEDKTDQVIQEALENSARLFPACVHDNRKNKEVDFLKDSFTRKDITSFGNMIMLSTFKTTNGALALFYPGVAEKMTEIMGGAFTAVFMNINDIMIFDLNDPMARQFAKQAGESGPMGEMLSNKRYRCDKNGVTVIG